MSALHVTLLVALYLAAGLLWAAIMFRRSRAVSTNKDDAFIWAVMSPGWSVFVAIMLTGWLFIGMIWVVGTASDLLFGRRA